MPSMLTLEEFFTEYPTGTRVRVIDADIESYVGATGVVVDYDMGEPGHTYPLVGVRFDRAQLDDSGTAQVRDGFYADELEVLR